MDGGPYSQEISKASAFFAERKMEKFWSCWNAKISSPLEVSVDTPNTFCLFLLLLILLLQTPLSVVWRAKPLGWDFTPLKATESKVCSVVEQHDVPISNLHHRGLSSGIPWLTWWLSPFRALGGKLGCNLCHLLGNSDTLEGFFGECHRE